MDNIYILKEIARWNKGVWKLFNLLNKEMNKYFCIRNKEYEICFREIKKDISGTYYLLDEKYHRTDGPAMIYNNGSENWYFNGILHRLDGPAKIWMGYCNRWYVNGKRHRSDGPAVEYYKECNKIHDEWFIDGKRIVKENKKE